MPIKMDGKGRKNPFGIVDKDVSQEYREEDVEVSQSGPYTIVSFDVRDIDFDRDSSTRLDPGSSGSTSSGIQIFSMSFELSDDEPGGIVQAKVQRVAEDDPVTEPDGNTYTYLKYRITLTIDPTLSDSNQRRITLGAPAPLAWDPETNTVDQTGGAPGADFYFSDLGVEEGIAISGNGLLEGTSALDCLTGSNKNDTLNGLGGDDYMLAGLGKDSLNGGSGSDFLNGFGATASTAPQIDELVGGSGSDTFVLGGAWGVSYVEEGDGYALIQDWNADEDKIQIRNLPKGQYSLEFRSINGIGSGAEDTEIYFTDASGFKDRIAIIKDATDIDNPGSADDSGNDFIRFTAIDGGRTIVGGVSNDNLTGNDADETLNGFGESASEAPQIDTLTGGYGLDTFVLGGFWGVSYVEEGDGYAVIKDWDANQDYIQVADVLGGTYSLDKSRNVIGSGAKDTELYFTDSDGSRDRIGIVQDTANVQIGRDFLFV